MLRNILLSTVVAVSFSACSFKMPFGIPFFSSSPKEDLEEANLCRALDSKEKKIKCYEDILDDNSYAQLRMGLYYADKQKLDKAFELLNESHENENLHSNLPLAFLYYKGDGVQRDFKKSFELLKEASEFDPNAAYQLSRFYLQGIETEVDSEKAINLIKFAANKNLKVAQEKLVYIYKEGMFGFQKDELNVKYWEEKLKNNKEDNSMEMFKL
jgi:uncharacterized protein